MCVWLLACHRNTQNIHGLAARLGALRVQEQQVPLGTGTAQHHPRCPSLGWLTHRCALCVHTHKQQGLCACVCTSKVTQLLCFHRTMGELPVTEHFQMYLFRDGGITSGQSDGSRVLWFPAGVLGLSGSVPPLPSTLSWL